MGQIAMKVRVISLDLMHALLHLLEGDWKAAQVKKDNRLIAGIGA